MVRSDARDCQTPVFLDFSCLAVQEAGVGRRPEACVEVARIHWQEAGCRSDVLTTATVGIWRESGGFQDFRSYVDLG